MSNLISAKMIKLPYFELILPAGLITYPFTFLLSDLVTEFFGARKAKLMVYIALGMNLLSLGIIQLALLLPEGDTEQAAFQAVLGLSGWRIFSSLTAYLISQIVDIQLYAWIKNLTGIRFLWLRNNGSTCVSQLLDTLIIDILYLYLALGMGLTQVFPIMLVSYAYKAFFSIANTPIFYLCVYLIKAEWKIHNFKPNGRKIYEPSM
jgi:uncharacterized integral membrane protein (TIGR00697 family)